MPRFCAACSADHSTGRARMRCCSMRPPRWRLKRVICVKASAWRKSRWNRAQPCRNWMSWWSFAQEPEACHGEEAAGRQNNLRRRQGDCFAAKGGSQHLHRTGLARPRRTAADRASPSAVQCRRDNIHNMILDRILANKYLEVAQRRMTLPSEPLRERALAQTPPRDFVDALK